MPKPIIRKWWVGLIQGIILIILSIYIFNNPLNALKGISIWIGIIDILYWSCGNNISGFSLIVVKEALVLFYGASLRSYLE